MKAITGRAGLRKCSSGGNAATAWELKNKHESASLEGWS